MTEEEKVKAEKDALEKVKTTATAAAETAVKKVKEDGEKAINDLKEAHSEELAALKAANEATQKHANELDVKLQKGGAVEKVKSLVEVLEAEKDALGKAVKVKGSEHEFFIKADTLRVNVVGNPAALDLDSIGQLGHRKLTLYDLFPKVPIGEGNNGVVRYVDWDPATTVRAAAAVAEGAVFPESTAKWATYTLDLKKVGDTIPMSEELIYDAPRFATELEMFLNTNVAIKIDTDLYSADGAGNNIKGIKNSVPAYTPVASGIVDASITDLVVKVSEDITKTNGSKYSPDFILMNITDINQRKLKKDANNNYVTAPFEDRKGNTVDGMLVIECNAVTPNELILGDRRYARIYEVPGVYVAANLNGTDWAEDMQTLKARKRLNLLIRKVDETGFRKVTSISAALTTLGTT